MLERVSKDKYFLTIYDIFKFNNIAKLVGNGQYFQQALESVRKVRDVVGKANYSGVTETIVRQSAQSMIAIDLHHLQDNVRDHRC